MTVQVTNLQGGGSGHGGTRYSDNLLSPDQPFGWGNNWAPLDTLVTVGTAFAGVDVAAAINRGATGLSYRNPGAGGFLPFVWAHPIPIDWSFCYTRNQYSQLRFISTTAGINRVGVCLFYDANGTNLYTLQLAVELLQYTIIRYNAGVSTTLLAPGAGTAFVANDLLRFEADITTTPGTTILRVRKNGVLDNTVNDNAAQRLTSGFFGLGGGGSNPAVTAIVSDYEGGKL